MKKNILMAVSSIALIAAAPAYAEMNVDADASAEAEVRTQNQSDMPETEVKKEDVQKTWNKTKESVSETTEEIGEGIENAYEKTKEAVTGEDSASIKATVVEPKTTVSSVIGQPVYNSTGERVAKVTDIILDQDGNATMAILGDGDFTGLGKNVAIEFSAISQNVQDGKIMAPVTEEMISEAAGFSYNEADYGANTRTVPANGYSVAKLLDGKIMNAQGESVGDVETITLQNGKAENVVVGFDKLLGLGGKKATLPFASLQPVQKDGQPHFKLSANQSAQFEAFKKQRTN